jgi:hypothetical protein
MSPPLASSSTSSSSSSPSVRHSRLLELGEVELGTRLLVGHQDVALPRRGRAAGETAALDDGDGQARPA